MARNRGTFNFAANYEPLIQGPLDARQIVPTYIELTNPSTWKDANGIPWAYTGMIVSITSDVSLSKNGIYYLADQSLYTDASYWIKIGAGSSISGTGMTIIEASSNLTVGSNQIILADVTYFPLSLTLPTTLSNGDIIEVIDIVKNSSVNNITLLRNSHLINNVAQDFVIDVNGGSVQLAYHSIEDNFGILNKETLIDYTGGTGGGGSGDVTKVYVDGSLAIRDVSIQWIVDNMTPSSLTQSYVDGSLAYRDISINALDKSLRLTNATYIPDSSLNSSTFKWIGGYLEPSVAGGGISQNYVDGSLDRRDVSLNNLYVFNTAEEASIANLYARVNYVDPCLGWSSILSSKSNASLGLFNPATINASIGAINVSLNLLTTLVYKSDVSIGIATALNTAEEASISNLYARVNYVDSCLGWSSILSSKSNASLGLFNPATINASISAINVSLNLLTTLTYKQDVSIGVATALNNAEEASISNLYARVNYVDSCLGWSSILSSKSNASLGLFNPATINTSIGNINTSLNSLGLENSYQDVSLNDIWIKLGYVDTSIKNLSVGAGVTQAYVDGSLALRDVSIKWLSDNMSGGVSVAYVDGSLARRDASLDNLYAFNSVEEASIGNLYARVNYVDSCLGWSSILSAKSNASLGLINIATLNASIGLLNSSVNVLTALAYKQDVSIGIATALNTAEEASISNLYSRVNYIDSCLGWSSILSSKSNSSLGLINIATLNASIGAINVSLNLLTTLTYKQDVSIGNLYAFNSSEEASIANLYARINYVDSCLGWSSILSSKSNSSLGLINISTLNTSIGNINTSLNSLGLENSYQDVSLNDVWIKFGYVDTCINNLSVGAGVTQAYVDGSLFLKVNEPSLGATSFYYDASGYLQTSGASGIGLVGKWKYKTGTGDTDPGSGNFTLNNADPSIATYVYVSNMTAGGSDVKNIILQLKTNDYFYVQKLPDSTENVTYRMSGEPIDATPYCKLPVVSVNSTGSFTSNKEFGFLFLFTGRSQYTTYNYVDSSLARRDASLDNLYQFNTAQEVSISNLYARVNYVDSCLGWSSILSSKSNASLGLFNPATINTSIGNINASVNVLTTLIYKQDVSVGIASALNNAEEASISNLYARVNYVDSCLGWASILATKSNASLGLFNPATINTSIGLLNASVNVLTALVYKQDVSIGIVTALNTAEEASIANLYARVNYVDSCLGWSSILASKSNASLGLVNIATLNASIGNINVSLNALGIENSYQDVSLNDVWVKFGYVDTCINNLGVGAGVTQAYVDGSLARRDASLDNLYLFNTAEEASISNLYARVNYVDSCLGWSSILSAKSNASLGLINIATLNASIGAINVSLNLLTTLTYKQDISVGNLYAFNTAQEASVSLALTKINVTDVSLLLVRATYIPDVSLNQSTFKWVNGYLEPSIQGGSGVSQAYVDGSLALRDASIQWIIDNPAGGVSVAYVDGSLARRDASLDNLYVFNAAEEASIANLYNRINYVDACLGWASILSAESNASLGLFNPATINTSIGNINTSLNSLVAGSGTVTQIAYFSQTKTITSDASFYYDSTNRRLALGTVIKPTNPAVLTVGSYLANPSYNVISAEGSLNNYLQINLQNYSGGGLNQSLYTATANNGTETSNYLSVGINGGGYTGNYPGRADDGFLMVDGSNLLIGTEKKTSIIFFTDGSNGYTNEKMRLTAEGSVGIKTSTPSQALDVSGNIRANNYVFDSSLASGNLTTSGMTLNLNAAQDTSFGDVAYISLGGKATIANASTLSTSYAVVMLSEVSLAANARGLWLTHGVAKNLLWTWTIGGPVYLKTGGNKGDTLTQTAPTAANTVTQYLGVAISPDSILFTPSGVMVEHV